MSDSVSIYVDDIPTPSKVRKVFDSETLGLDLHRDLIGRLLRTGVFLGLDLSSAAVPISNENRGFKFLHERCEEFRGRKHFRGSSLRSE